MGWRLTLIGSALFIFIRCVSLDAQDAWDLANCRARAEIGHVCTIEHLENDLAALRRSELVDSPTTPAVERMLRVWAETGVVEQMAALERAKAAGRAFEEPRVSSRRESLWRAKETVALTGIKSILVSIEDSKDDPCRPTTNRLRLAATRPIIDGGLDVVESNDLVSPTLYVNVLAHSTAPEGCAAFLSVSLRNYSYVAPSYQQAQPALGSILLMSPWLSDRPGEPNVHSVAVAMGMIQLAEDGALLTGPRSGFGERVTDQVRRQVDDFVTQIKLANRSQ